MTPTRALFLFDIDGTLLLTGGVARQAFSAAVLEVLGVEDDLAGVEFAGRTEPLIVAEILARRGLAFRDGQEPVFWDALARHMARLFVAPRGQLLPGVPELLDAIERRPGLVAGLLTGNMTRVARIKLARFGLEDRFRLGTFGEEAPDRNALALLAARRAQERLGVPPARAIVVGDTHRDIECARSAGMKAVAVATGGMSPAELAAYTPDLLLVDLSDAVPLLEFAEGLGAA
jgi:phosphoglycolate phosphatase-like HAD superfamily hydrolase